MKNVIILAILITSILHNNAKAQTFTEFDSIHANYGYLGVYETYSEKPHKFNSFYFNNSYIISSTLFLEKYIEAKQLLKKDTLLDELDKLDLIVFYNNKKAKKSIIFLEMYDLYVTQFCKKNGYNENTVTKISSLFQIDQNQTFNYLKQKLKINSKKKSKSKFKDYSTKYFKKLLASNTFPTPKDCGEATIDRAIILIKHSEDTSLHKDVLALIHNNKDYDYNSLAQSKAILIDQILLTSIGIQLYGTQVDGIGTNPQLCPLLSPKHVNDLRKEIGINFSVETYLNFFK